MLSKFTAVGSSPAKYGRIKTSLAHNGLLTFFFNWKKDCGCRQCVETEPKWRRYVVLSVACHPISIPCITVTLLLCWERKWQEVPLLEGKSLHIWGKSQIRSYRCGHVGLPCSGAVKVLRNPKRVNFAKCRCFMQSSVSDVCLFRLLPCLVFRLTVNFFLMKMLTYVLIEVEPLV